MEDLSSNLNNLRLRYREIFLKTAQKIKNRIDDLKPDNFEGEILDKYAADSAGFLWQKSALDMLDQEIFKEVCEKISKIKQCRQDYSCIGCGACCKLACSEFSFEELKLKAQKGDGFAGQFTQTFIPYESVEDAKKVYPQYIKLLEEENETGYYFYHCLKVTEDNRCPDYENRPQICRDFPDNPLAFLPPVCGYKDWKIKSEPVSLTLNAMVEIAVFYKDKIKELQE